VTRGVAPSGDKGTTILPTGPNRNEIPRQSQLHVDVERFLDRGHRAQDGIRDRVKRDIDVDSRLSPSFGDRRRSADEVETCARPRAARAIARMNARGRSASTRVHTPTPVRN
jgi:hypothetical protein